MKRLRAQSYRGLLLKCIPALVSHLCVAVIVLTTVYSGIEYFVVNRDVFRGAL